MTNEMPTEKIRVRLQTGEYDFVFPQSVYLRNMIVAVLQGQDYPLIKLPNYLPTTIVDAGANVGAATLYFYNAYPNATFYCYEPSRDNFECLKENTKYFANIHLFPYGLLDRDAELPLYHGTSQSAQNSVMKSNETFEKNEVINLVKTAKEMENRNLKNISILKIDTEGCEVPIISDCLSVVDKIDMIYFEYHSEEDRLEIDRMVSDKFVLHKAKTDTVHRGTGVYISKALVNQYPGLNKKRILRI
ncbi:MAG: FkbM family methyltransferase [Hormoscilla sp.]